MPGKYDGQFGPFNNSSHIVRLVHPQLQLTLAKALNCSQSKASWQQYNSVIRCLSTLEAESGIDFTLPWSEVTLVNYMVLQARRGIMMSSVKTYLSRIRAAHRFKGYKMVESEWTCMLYKGLGALGKPQTPRLAMTPDKLQLLKSRLAASSWRGEKRRLFWMACCFAFHGALRSSEYLPASATSCNRAVTLLVQDVKLECCRVKNENVNVISLVLKEPKELKKPGSKASLELFQTQDFMCPISAWKKYMAHLEKSKRSLVPSDPLFMLDGFGYTRQNFNSDIKHLLQDVIDYNKGKLLSHSFRSGLVTAMARAGFSQENIQLVGRWSSEAYLNYIKQGRSARFETMKEISSRMTELASTWSPGVLVV